MTMEKLTEYGALNPEDVRATLAGLSGTYASRALYERYCEIARAAGREPDSIAAFAMKLSDFGCQRRKVRNIASWLV